VEEVFIFWSEIRRNILFLKPEHYSSILRQPHEAREPSYGQPLIKTIN
jgi:hypothetical protein